MSILPLTGTPISNPPAGPIRVLGIDLGTTNSTVAEVVWDPAIPGGTTARCLEIAQPTPEGSYVHVLVPSMVALQGDSVFVGEGAKRLRARSAGLKLERYEKLFYECKNEMGIPRTYHRAPEGFRSAQEIGGKVLSFLKEAALEEGDLAPSRIVVTVPASFQAAQRTDTLSAAEMAGLEVQGGDLLDEPVAAFLDYLVTHLETLLPELTTPKNLVVFDFGGGTCDVAVLRLEGASELGNLNVAWRSVSRYHRLGGGDIDAAILYEVLLPQLVEQNGLAPYSLDYGAKKRAVEPALLSVAESLKIGISTEVARLEKFGKYEGAARDQIVKRLPGSYPCPVPGRELWLRSPQITAEQFEQILEPFLDRRFLHARTTDYRMTRSVFAPLLDALERSDLEPEQVDYCLLVGGSSLISQVFHAVTRYFPAAEVLRYEDPESLQTAVARGAAYHSLALALTGRGLIQPVCHDTIALRTAAGPAPLIQKGTSLPCPADGGRKVYGDLRVPEDALTEPLELGIEIVAAEDDRLLYGATWTIPAPVGRGDHLILEYSYDENQILDFRMWLGVRGRMDQLRGTLDKPLTNVVNPDLKQLAISELEELLRTGRIPPALRAQKFVELADLYGEIGHRERALDLLKGALRHPGVDQAVILNRMADCAFEMGDYESEERYYREATEIGPWFGSWFNLSLALKRRGRLEEAAEAADRAAALDDNSPTRVLRAMLAELLDDSRGRTRYLNEAMATFGPVKTLSDWELGWFLSGAKMDGNEDLVRKAQAEQRRRRQQRNVPFAEEGYGVLPALTDRGPER